MYAFLTIGGQGRLFCVRIQEKQEKTDVHDKYGY